MPLAKLPPLLLLASEGSEALQQGPCGRASIVRAQPWRRRTDSFGCSMISGRLQP